LMIYFLIINLVLKINMNRKLYNQKYQINNNQNIDKMIQN
jgi:hypothetical protein